MAVYQVPPKVFLRFLLPVCVAAGILIFLYLFFSGPRLGPHYDYLMRRRPPPPVSREVVILETEKVSETQQVSGFIEPAAVSSILMTLAEMGVRGLAVQAPGLSGSRDERIGRYGGPVETELPRRLDEEFTLLAGNIRNLFQAILIGSVSPEEAEQYVDNLIGLSEQGKERLLSVLARKDNPETRRIERAAAVFGFLWEARSLRAASGETSSGGGLYSHSSLDRDGVFRRIYPLGPGSKHGADRTEHVVYAMMNYYLGPSDIEYRKGIPQIRFKREGFVRDIALDSRGAVLVERPRRDEDFKRLTPEDFTEYERADQELARCIDTLGEQGYFIYLAPEAYPTMLYEYSHMLREELLEDAGHNPVKDVKARWLDARAEYLRRLENFAAGPSETNLVMRCEERIAAEGLDAEELRQVVSLRNDIISAFAAFREKYDELLRIRSGLSSVLTGSFCIMGPGAAPPPDSPGVAALGTGPGNFPARLFPHVDREPVPSDTEVSAILANAILSGRAVIFPPGQYIFLWSLLTVLLILFLIRRMGPVLTLVSGLAMTILAGAVFSWGFILTRYWVDPLIPAGSAAAGVFTSFLYVLYTKRRNQARIRRLYGGAVGPAYLKRLVRAGQPQTGETLMVRAAIVAIRQGNLQIAESGKDPLDSAGEIRAFREAAARRFKHAGGVIVGIDGDLVLAAFGSPLERLALKKERPYDDDPAPDHHSPEAKAVGFVVELLKEAPESASWRFGIDAGNCAFGYSEISGYAAFGRPVVHARILSGVASRYHARILVTARVNGSISGFLTRKLDVIASIAGKEKDPFYEIRLS